jgi:hypothetical protein
MWEVIQTVEFKEWYDDLDEDAKEDILSSVIILQNSGPVLGRPKVDTLKGSKIKNLKELRVQSNGRPFRIFFLFDSKKNIVLLNGGNKRNDKSFYKRKILESEKIYKEYFF